jgi:hypothetical protein
MDAHSAIFFATGSRTRVPGSAVAGGTRRDLPMPVAVRARFIYAVTSSYGRPE